MNLNTPIGKKKGQGKAAVPLSAYPSKTNMNLFYMVDKSAKPANIVVYGIFVLVLLMALGKYGVYDFIEKRNAAEAALDTVYAQLDDKNAELMRYNEVEKEYSLISYGYLSDTEAVLYDRIELLTTLEEGLMRDTSVDAITVSANSVRLTLTCESLSQLSGLCDKLELLPQVDDTQILTYGNENDEGGMKASLIISFVIPAEGGEEA